MPKPVLRMPDNAQDKPRNVQPRMLLAAEPFPCSTRFVQNAVCLTPFIFVPLFPP